MRTQAIFVDRPSRVEIMARLTSDQVDRLVIGVYAHDSLDSTRCRAVGPYRAVLVVLIYLRHNLSQALVAELFGCSQPTVSRLIGRLAPAITTVLTENARRVAAQQLRSTVRIDGFLAPTGDHREGTYTPGMYSGKRHRCGFNIQVVGSAYGRLVLVGAPQPGAMHDAKAWHASGLAALFAGRLPPTADPADSPISPTSARACAYHAAGPNDQDLSESAREHNRAIASHRASLERLIAHLKNWKLLATGYRGLLDRFPTLLDTITKLEIYRTS